MFPMRFEVGMNLLGANEKKDGYSEGGGYLVSWCAKELQNESRQHSGQQNKIKRREEELQSNCATGICFLALIKFFIHIAICFIITIGSVIFMNMKIISKYLQFLRKSRNYTQDDLAKKLDISRQAVSKWETGAAIPDLEILLKISQLYEITINDILESRIRPQRITDFEQIATIPEKELKEVIKQFDTRSLVIALMGASPETNGFCEKVFPYIDFEMTRNDIGRIRIETVEDMQNQIISMINLQAIE